MSGRLAGHELLYEGAAYVSHGKHVGRVRENGTSGTGFAVCSCKARSPILDSGNLRKAWHRNHKNEIRTTEES